MKKKILLLLLVVTFCIGLSAGQALAVPIGLDVSPDPIYSGDTVTINVLPFIGNTDYFAWANMQGQMDSGLIDPNNPVNFTINGMDGGTVSSAGGGDYYFFNIVNATGVDFLPDNYGGTYGSDPSTVSGEISFVAGQPGTYYFITNFHTGDLNWNDSLGWWQPSQLYYPPWGDIYITVLDGGGGDPSIPEPTTLLLLGGGLLGLVGYRKKN